MESAAGEQRRHETALAYVETEGAYQKVAGVRVELIFMFQPRKQVPPAAVPDRHRFRYSRSSRRENDVTQVAWPDIRRRIDGRSTVDGCAHRVDVDNPNA